MSKNRKNNYKEFIDEVLEEAHPMSSHYDSAGGTPLRGAMGPTVGKTWSPGEKSPKHKAITGPTGFDIAAIQAQERLEHMAPKQKPYPLDIVYEHLVEAFIALMNAHGQIRATHRSYPVLTETERDLLESINKKIEEINEDIKNVGEALDKFTLDI
jgi:hypothetical protein